MKMQDLITFSSVFFLSVFPNPMPNQTLLLWSQMESPGMPIYLSEAVPAGFFKEKKSALLRICTGGRAFVIFNNGQR